MNTLLEKTGVQISSVGIADRGSYGSQTLSEAANRRYNMRPTVFHGDRLQTHIKGPRRAMRASSHHGFSFERYLVTGSSLISEVKDLPPSAYASVIETTGDKQTPASEDEIRYRELTQKHFVHGLSPMEQQELANVEGRLDAADEADPSLRVISAEINDGYDHLRHELKHINEVLDRLLAT